MREYDESRYLNFELAQLVAFAYHDPKNMPSFSTSADDASEAKSAVDEAKVRGFFISMAMKGK